MKTLIIGDGLVGTALHKHIKDALGTTRGIPDKNEVFVDITRYETLFKVFSDFRPNIVYLAASNANVDACEDISTNRDNLVGAVNVLRLCEGFDAKLVYFSSSYVFNGKSKYPYSEKQETDPVQNYGKQKEHMEKLIVLSDTKHLIIRTVGVFGQERTDKNFAKRVLYSIAKGKKVFAPDDQYMNPIFSDDLAKVTIHLSEKHNGIFNVAGDTCMTKYEFAKRIAGQNFEKLVISTSSEEMKQKAVRPKMGCLDCSVIGSLGIKIPSFDAGLELFLESELNE